jgi:hypothetical protein
MDEEKTQQIGLWRYTMIAPLLHHHGRGQMHYVRKVSTTTLYNLSAQAITYDPTAPTVKIKVKLAR